MPWLALAPDRIGHMLGRAPMINGRNALAWAIRSRIRYDLSDLNLAVDQPRRGCAPISPLTSSRQASAPSPINVPDPCPILR